MKGGEGKRAPTGLDRWLRIVTEVRSGEGATALILLASVFLLLAAYYFIKPARDGLLAVSEIQAVQKVELKAYASFGQSLILLVALPLYDALYARLSRRRLLATTSLFFFSNLIVFWGLQPGLFVERAPYVGVVFYLWVGIFNVFVVAQFWSFTADLYDDERGRRLMPMVMIGASVGATAGAWMASVFVEVFGTWTLMLFAAAFLAASTVLLRLAERRGPVGDGPPRENPAAEEGSTAGATRLVFRHRYLFATAAFIMLLNWVNTNGENLMFGVVQDVIARQAPDQGDVSAFVTDRTTAFYGDFFFWVNLCALLMQALLASRLLRYGGFGSILMMLPVIALLSYGAMALVPVLAVIKVMKVAENSVNYSIMNTARQVLWLPTTREMKYKAKAAIDTVFVRFGDGLAALTVLVGVRWLSLGNAPLFAFNVGLVLGWIAIGVVVVRQHRAWAAAASER